MAARFVNIDHDTPLLLPPDLRDWVPEDHLVHFIMEAVGLLDLSTARINHRGTGSDQYPPSMMLGLLIYCYASGTFSSRRIERLTHENVAVRLLCADRHPDHDSICTFRTGNRALLESSFHQVLEVAARVRVLRVGDVTLALDGTKILASASKHSAVSHGHACKQMVLLEEQIAELLAKADAADSAPLEDGLSVPEEIARRRDRIGKLREATAVIEARAKERHREELAAFQARQREREEKQNATGKPPRGREPKPPQEGPRARDQYNFTDPESRMMKTADGFAQTYNAQAAVEIQSRLVVSAAVTDAPNDKQQLVPTLGCVSPVVKSIGAVLIELRILQRGRHRRRRARRRRHARAADLRRHRPATPRAHHRAARAAGRPARPRRARERQGNHGAPARDASRAETLRATQTNHRARVRDHQSGDGVPAVQPARDLQSAPRMDAGDTGLQPQAPLPRRRGPGRSIRTPRRGTLG